MLKGQHITTLDKSDRVRLPSKLRKSIEDQYGKEIFITSLDGEHVHIFPVFEWKNMTYVAEEGVLQNLTIRTFVLRANRLGIKREIDRWGRILIHKELREKVNLKGKIIVEGAENHLLLKQNALIQKILRLKHERHRFRRQNMESGR